MKAAGGALAAGTQGGLRVAADRGDAAGPQSRQVGRGRTRENRSPGRTEEREKLHAREAGLAEGQVAFPRGQRSLVPLLSADPGKSDRSSFPPRLGGELFCQVPGRYGAGAVSGPTATESSLSGREAASSSLLGVLVCSQGKAQAPEGLLQRC